MRKPNKRTSLIFTCPTWVVLKFFDYEDNISYHGVRATGNKVEKDVLNKPPCLYGME